MLDFTSGHVLNRNTQYRYSLVLCVQCSPLFDATIIITQSPSDIKGSTPLGHYRILSTVTLWTFVTVTPHDLSI
jgi:hypothetical protein